MESEIRNIHEKLVNREISCVSLIKERLDLLKENTYNTVNFLLEDSALELAKKVDEKLERGEEIGLLEGIPFGLKDVYMLQGEYASASSDMLKQYKSPYTATAIQKLLDAGAIPLVKENCDAYGHGSSSENTIFGATKNAIDPNLVAGGSSGGSAVNVAKGYTVFSIGGDTGGSIRQPAGYNNIYGLKPTYGRISRYGIMAYASSTDCVGPLASSIEDIRIVLNEMSGKDIKDLTTFESTAIDEAVFDESKSKNLVVGYYKNFVDNNEKLKREFDVIFEKLEERGITVKALDFFDTDILVSTYYTIAMAETASNLSRLDGINYGSRITGKNLKETYSNTRSENFSEETKRRVVGGNQVLSQGHSEAIYLKALSLRDEIVNHFENDFNSVDVIISPVTTDNPPEIGSSLKDPHSMYLSDAYTVGFSLGQLPTLTIPKGTSTGIQISAAKNQEEKILTFANLLKGTI